MTAAGGRRFALALALAVVVGVAIRIAFVAGAAPALPDPGDAMAYHLLADGLADGDGYVRPYDRREGRSIATAEYGPAYPALLAMGDLAGIDSTHGQRYLGAVFGATAITLVGLSGRRIGGPAVGVVAAALVASSPVIVQHDTALLTEGLAVAAAAAVLLLALGVSHEPGPSLARMTALGAAIGGAALVRTDAVVLAAVVALPLALLARRGLRARCGVVALAGVLAVTGPWMVRNAIQLDRFVGISTNAATVLDGANCPSTYEGDLVGYWRFSDDCFDGYDTSALVRQGEAAVAADHLGAGVDYVLAEWTRLPVVVGARLLRLWGAWDVDQQVYLAALEGRATEWERVAVPVGWATVVVACAGLAVLARRRHEVRDLVALVGPCAAVTISAAITYGNPRFRAAAEPALAVLAAVAVVAGGRAVARR